MMKNCSVCIVLALILWPPGRLLGENEFQPIFDGRTFEGWETPDPSYWSIENGAITGRITADHPCTVNQYLVWRGGDLADFELKLKSRLQGQGGINNGFQFRSRLLPDHDVCGYQVDNNLETPWLVRLYDEYGRHTLAWRGERTIFDRDGNRMTTKLQEAQAAAWFRLEDWHEYHLVCVGNRISLRVDGQLAAEVEDNDLRRFEPQGVLALQLHSGPVTTVQFKDIRLKILKEPAPTLSPELTPADRQLAILRGQALAFWPLDTGGHGAHPALRHIPGWDKFELNVRAAGPGARPGANVVLLQGAYFDASSDLHIGDNSMTVYLRLRDPQGTWNSGLVNKGATLGSTYFRVFGHVASQTSGPEIAFSVGTDEGLGTVSFPVSAIASTAWHDLVGRYDGTSLALYCDGRQMASRDWTGRLRKNDDPLLIGAELDHGKVTRHFSGELEQTGLWSRALADGEIALLSAASSSPSDRSQPARDKARSETGSIDGRVTYSGPVPKSAVADDGGVRRDLLQVDSAAGGLQGVVIYLAAHPAAPEQSIEPASPALSEWPTAIIDQQGHEFVPRVLAVREGQIVRFTNSDAANHNVRTSTTVATNQFNVYTGIGGQYERVFTAHPELRPIVLGCDIHPWMRGWVYVFKHGQFAVTDSSGRFAIPSVPPGEYRLILKQPDIRYSREELVTVTAGRATKIDVPIQAQDASRKISD